MTRRDSLFLLAAPALAQTYALTPDSQPQDGVPKGQITKRSFRSSKLFPGTVRDYWVYVPAQYKPDQTAALMVFQDGGGMVTDEGAWRAPTVLDNLIHKREIPVMIAVFVNPGVMPALNESQQGRYNRSFEYDSLSDRYARFLIDELLPEVEKDVHITRDPNLRAIGGSSSGASCAFTVAWNRPDSFRRVLSFIGSYVNLRGAHVYPSLIRKTEPRPLRVFLQDGDKDLNIYSGNWWMANQDMASALEYAGYDFTFVKGTEGHNSRHGAAVLPDALRWLWRDADKPIAKPSKEGERQYAQMFVEPGEDWQLVSQGHRFTEGPAVDRDGNLFFTDIPNNRVHKVDGSGNVSVFKDDSAATNGLMVGPDGKLYACQNGRKRIVAWSMDGAETVVVEGIESNDLCLTAKGDIYFTDPRNKRVWYLGGDRKPRVVHEGGGFLNGVVLSPDQSLLFVNDSESRLVWSFQIQPDGSLINGQRFYKLEIPDDSDRTTADGMTVDSEGHLYVTTQYGLQICDQPGRVVAILNKPQAGPLANVVFGGADLKTLHVTAGDKVFKRRMRRTGVVSWQPVKPPVPRL